MNKFKLTENRSNPINRDGFVDRHEIVENHPPDLEDIILLVLRRVMRRRSDYHNLPVLIVFLSQRQENSDR